MKLRRPRAGFTLIELIMVIAIIGVVTALALPVLSSFRKGDAMLAATRQMLDAVSRARQLAIGQHTTVYLVFAPPTLWADPFYANPALTAAERQTASNVLDHQLIGYAFVSLRTVGDQPGQRTPRYLSSWQTLPESSFVAPWKFSLAPNQQFQFAPIPDQPGRIFVVRGFEYANDADGPTIPFPSAEIASRVPPVGPYAVLPYIAFDYLGRLVSGRDEYIPLAHGSVLEARDPNTKAYLGRPPSVLETPPGNSTNISFNLIHIDWLTGRPRLERAEVR